MKLVKYGLLLLILGFAAGCTIEGPGVKIHVPSPVDIDVGTGHVCPPGQAKKGNC